MQMYIYAFIYIYILNVQKNILGRNILSNLCICLGGYFIKARRSMLRFVNTILLVCQ